MANENIGDIKERVSALLRKASDGAATPAEAEAAMRLAQKLMGRYQVTEADLDNGDGTFKTVDREGRYSPKKGEYYLHPVERYCAAIVGRFCGVEPYTATENGKLVLHIFGLDSDVELANWMLTSFVQQFEADWLLYKQFKLDTKRLVTIKDARLSFATGFTTAVNERLNDWLFRKSPEEGTADTSNALVIRKLDLVEQKLAEMGLSLSRGRHRRKSGGHGDARSAGFMSGSRAETGRGVGQSAIAIGRN